MTRKEASSQNQNRDEPGLTSQVSSYYEVLGVNSRASVADIRKAYRELSKRYHPDTTELPEAIATAKFQQLNEAYATLTNPQKRLIYEQKQRSYYRDIESQNLRDYKEPIYSNNSAYLDPTDRPLSPGEIFVLFLMGLTLVGCLILAIAIGLTRPDVNLGPITPPGSTAADYNNFYSIKTEQKAKNLEPEINTLSNPK